MPKSKTSKQILDAVKDLDCTKAVTAEVEKVATSGVKKLKKNALKACLKSSGDTSLGSADSLTSFPAPQTSKKRKSSDNVSADKGSEESASAKKSISLRGQILELTVRVGALERLLVSAQLQPGDLPPSEKSAAASEEVTK